jgi:hypothetical protein
MLTTPWLRAETRSCNMSSLEWQELHQMIRRADRHLPRPKREPVYTDTLIVAMCFRAVRHDRPHVWACDRRNYHRPFLPRRLPSVSRFNRRNRTPGCHAILQAVEQMSRPAEAPAVQLLDDRPLSVGACSAGCRPGSSSTASAALSAETPHQPRKRRISVSEDHQRGGPRPRTAGVGKDFRAVGCEEGFSHQRSEPRRVSERQRLFVDVC